MVILIRIAVKASSRMNVDGANITTFAAASKRHLRPEAIDSALVIDDLVALRGFSGKEITSPVR